jgi:pimeloyl-ACP methyl ester carboxylesterase
MVPDKFAPHKPGWLSIDAFRGVTPRLKSLSLPLMEAESLSMIEVDDARIVYRRMGKGRPLVVLNGFGATSADWDPSFIYGFASSNELILVNNRGMGGSADDGQSFDIAKLADDAAHVIENLGVERANVMGWSMGGFIAQALALKYADRVDKLVLLSTDYGGIEADLASANVWSELIDTSGTPNEQARRLLFLLFPNDVAVSFYRQFGDIVAAARAQLSVELLNRQSAAMDAWHRNGVASQLREIRVPVLIATGTDDIVIPASNALKLVNAIPSAWLAQFPHGGHAFMAQYPRALANLINSFLAVDGPAFAAGLTDVCTAYRAVAAEERLSRRSARPCFPAFADRLCVAFHVHFLQPFDAIFERLGRFFIFFPGRFIEWPQKREREKSPVESSYWRFHLDLVFALARSNVTDREANGDAKPQRAENSRHGIFAQKTFRAL